MEKDWGWLAVVDWLAVKTEYVTTATSYRELARKYGVSRKTIADRGKAGNWVRERGQYRDESTSKMKAAAAQGQAERAERFVSAADKLLGKIEEIVGSDNEQPLAPKDIRALTAAMGDLKGIMGIQSNADAREQEARIANLERQARADVEKDPEITVRLTGGLESYAQ